MLRSIRKGPPPIQTMVCLGGGLCLCGKTKGGGLLTFRLCADSNHEHISPDSDHCSTVQGVVEHSGFEPLRPGAAARSPLKTARNHTRTTEPQSRLPRTARDSTEQFSQALRTPTMRIRIVLRSGVLLRLIFSQNKTTHEGWFVLWSIGESNP